MIVCIIAEGSYPYITGGVSSWIHQLIQGMPDINFKVLSLMPSYKENLEQKYTLPRNLIEIKTIYFDDYLNLSHRKTPIKVKLNESEKQCLEKFLFMEEDCNWDELISIIGNKQKIGSTLDFLQSNVFWEMAIKMYTVKFKGEVFNTFFWTLRTMMLPFLHLLQQDMMEADLYHAVSTGYAGLLGASLKKISGKPFVLTEHGIYAREREEEILKAKWVTGVYKKMWIDFFFIIAKSAYQSADRIISLFERNRIIQIDLGSPKDRTKIIPNGVDLSRFSATKVPHEGYNIGAILRIVPIKDVMTLIRAFKIVKEEVNNAQLFLIGPTDEDSDYSRQCLDLIRILGLEESVIITGNVDVREYYKKIDVLVLTSISEGQPLVILEGMATGTPIVATDVGSCKELIEEDENEGTCGGITNPVSPNETAAHIIRILKNNELSVQMGQNGRCRAERAYSKEKFINNYSKIYKELG